MTSAEVEEALRQINVLMDRLGVPPVLRGNTDDIAPGSGFSAGQFMASRDYNELNERARRLYETEQDVAEQVAAYSLYDPKITHTVMVDVDPAKNTVTLQPRPERTNRWIERHFEAEEVIQDRLLASELHGPVLQPDNPDRCPYCLSHPGYLPPKEREDHAQAPACPDCHGFGYKPGSPSYVRSLTGGLGVGVGVELRPAEPEPASDPDRHPVAAPAPQQPGQGSPVRRGRGRPVVPAPVRDEGGAVIQDRLWFNHALERLRQVAEEKHVFTSDEVREKLTMTPHVSMGALGAVFAQAKRNGWIEATGMYRPSKYRGQHKRPIRIWRSALFTDKAFEIHVHGHPTASGLGKMTVRVDKSPPRRFESLTEALEFIRPLTGPETLVRLTGVITLKGAQL